MKLSQLNTRKEFLLVALILPILALGFLTLQKKFHLFTGKEVELPIFGYDPRDLLSGHYLTYRVDYGIGDPCSGDLFLRGHYEAYLCLEPVHKITREKPQDCRLFIKGTCEYRNFRAGIERFYIPEDRAPHLEKLLREKKSSIIISISSSGEAQVKDLLIEGLSWRDYQ